EVHLEGKPVVRLLRVAPVPHGHLEVTGATNTPRMVLRDGARGGLDAEVVPGLLDLGRGEFEVAPTGHPDHLELGLGTVRQTPDTLLLGPPGLLQDSLDLVEILAVSLDGRQLIFR